ncbi:hypothetical protein [Polaribacter atrinae]|uniref:hypothetical protein n=1 Tax=Polaribacter atrinae TaxID=1333662 RepID=UPI0030F54008
MKKISLVLALLFLSFHSYSQDKPNNVRLFELQKKKVEIDISADVFTSVYHNMYVSKNPDALILGVFLPISYDNQKVKLSSAPKTTGMEFKGEITLNNEKVLWVSGTIIKKGIEFNKHKYYIKQEHNTCIELTTMLAVTADAKEQNMVMDIVNSVIDKN